MLLKNFSTSSIDDFIADSELEMRRLKSVIENRDVFPGSKTGILLHGTYGAGKTQLARIIPRELERHRVDEFDQKSFDDLGYIFESCASSGGRELVERAQPTAISFHDSRLHYVVLDEFDNLRKDAQKNMKSFMTEHGHVIYIMTTNHISKIDKGIISRSHCVSFESPSKELWFQKCRQVANDNGIRVTDDEIHKIVNSANGDARQIRAQLEEYMILDAA